MTNNSNYYCNTAIRFQKSQFPYEATIKSNGHTPQGGKTFYAENLFRWIAWVQPGCNATINFRLKLSESYKEGNTIPVKNCDR
ncbi:hypothetical protein J2128_002096 [Methanomicrobium sp. W14]|uniref:hypothetical protein n=1 Tax=Methanomicrobium sp. W14 TaxID=2817839 RepID=UPI001AEAEBA5|nr:hypothetical protein [Methanomicrobium sp. W14]MBP2134130.1 hypothetical protein [Methanomicrobium sp. W14]